jgi:hypothetical protein
MKQILDLPLGQRIADVHHHREANNLGRAVELTEGIAHRQRLGNPAKGLKPINSDKASEIIQKRRLGPAC